jgi:hypothetical protein
MDGARYGYAAKTADPSAALGMTKGRGAVGLEISYWDRSKQEEPLRP